MRVRVMKTTFGKNLVAAACAAAVLVGGAVYSAEQPKPQGTKVEAFVPIAFADMGAQYLACEAREICMWWDVNYGRWFEEWTYPVADLEPYGWDNKAGTVCNNSGDRIGFKQFKNYDGLTLYLNSGYCWPNLTLKAKGSGTWSDSISSFGYF
jgi:hypothetical protein